MKFSFLSVCIVVSALFSTLSHADEKGPCGEDGPKLCKKANFGAGGMFSCLVKKKNQASPKCQQHIDRLLTHKKDCKNDIALLCTKVGKPFYCLLYPSTVEALWSKGSRKCLSSILLKASYLKKCRAELDERCSAVSGAPVEMVQCLRGLKVKSTACQGLLDK